MTSLSDKASVAVRLVNVVLVSFVQKLPFSLPPLKITFTIALLATLILGFLVGTPISRALTFGLEILPQSHQFLTFHTLFLLGIYLPISIMFPTIAPTSARLRFLARLPLSQRILGFCLMSPVIAALLALLLTTIPGYITVSVKILDFSYLNALVILLGIALVAFMHAQLTYVLSSNLAVRYSTLGLNISTANAILAFCYAALLIFAVKESFLGEFSTYSSFANIVLFLFQWPLMLIAATKFNQWFPLIPLAIILFATGSFIALLPYTLAPRVNTGFGLGGRFISRLIPQFPQVVLFLRFLRAPRSRESIYILTLVTLMVTAITFMAPKPLQSSLIDQLLFILAVFSGSFSSLWSSITTSPVEAYEFQIGLSSQKMRAITLVFSLIYVIGFSFITGAIVLLILNQPLVLLSKLIVASIITGLIGYLYGALALTRSYYRAPMDGLAVFICGFALSLIANLGEKMGYPIGSLKSSIAVSGVLLAAIIIAFISAEYKTGPKIKFKTI